MSAPRRIRAGVTYLISRRCFARYFFLRPSKKINQIFKFCLAVAAARTGVVVHNLNCLSNHYHIVVTDVEGRLPEFKQWLNKHLAKCVNAELGRWESVFAPGSYSAVELVDHDDVIGALLYVFTNPVGSGLVSSMKEWPGAHSTPADMERPAEVVARPTGFFRANGPVPATAQLRLSMPPGVNLSVDELEKRVAEHEQGLRDKLKAEKRRFLGRDRVLRQSPFDQPRTQEERRGLNPRVAAKDRWRRMEALQRLKSFLSDYRDAWLAFAAGDRDVQFLSAHMAWSYDSGSSVAGPDPAPG